jgi:hypothetical protein
MGLSTVKSVEQCVLWQTKMGLEIKTINEGKLVSVKVAPLGCSQLPV